MAYQGCKQKCVWRLRPRSKEPGDHWCVPLPTVLCSCPDSSYSLLCTKGLSIGFCEDCCWHCSRPDIGTMTLWDLVQIPTEAFQIGWFLFVFGLFHECRIPVTEGGGRAGGSLLCVALFWNHWSKPTLRDSRGSVLVYCMFPHPA